MHVVSVVVELDVDHLHVTTTTNPSYYLWLHIHLENVHKKSRPVGATRGQGFGLSCGRDFPGLGFCLKKLCAQTERPALFPENDA